MSIKRCMGLKINYSKWHSRRWLLWSAFIALGIAGMFLIFLIPWLDIPCMEFRGGAGWVKSFWC